MLMPLMLRSRVELRPSLSLPCLMHWEWNTEGKECVNVPRIVCEGLSVSTGMEVGLAKVDFAAIYPSTAAEQSNIAPQLHEHVLRRLAWCNIN